MADKNYYTTEQWKGKLHLVKDVLLHSERFLAFLSAIGLSKKMLCLNGVCNHGPRDTRAE